MTPSLLQKIELLTLNRLEFSDLLNQELSENPVLEEIAGQAEVEGAESSEEREKSDDTEGYEDFDYEYFFGEYLSPSSRSREWEGKSEQPSFELFLATPSTLNDHLNWQLNLSEVASEIRDICYFIIGNIDEDGYLILPVEEIADSLKVSEEQVEESLASCAEPGSYRGRNPKPAGVFADPDSGDRVGEFAGREACAGLPSLYSGQKVSRTRQETRLRSGRDRGSHGDDSEFSPKPGQKYSTQSPVYIQPDVHIYKVGDEYQISLNDDGLPKLRLSRAYRELLRKKDVSKETKSFVKERFRSAMELLKSVDQRQQTIYRACVAIVERQKDFLDRGPSYLKPMLIKDVAEELGVHSSTVSRVVANKHAYTPQGVIALRKFFTSGIESSDGENLSVVQVKERIKAILANEDTQKPLSDQKISRLLNEDGIHITRRTVAKYRDQMRIPGSRERKMAVLF